MKKQWFLVAIPFTIMACNNSGKDTVQKADSANTANNDTSLKHNAIVVDENSSSFLTKAANGGMTEVQLAQLAQDKASSQRVKDFSAMMIHDHSATNDKVKALAGQKNIVLPQVISDDKQKVVSDLSVKSGKEFDKAFMKIMVNDHEETIDLFTKALTTAKDPDVNSFADKTLPTLRMHLDSAKAVQSSIK